MERSDDVNEVCTADAVPVVVTITGLATPPEQLTVNEEGSPAEVVAVTGSAASDTVDLSCLVDQRISVAFDGRGPGQPTPQEAVAPLLGGLLLGRTTRAGRQATVTAVTTDGDVLRVYSLTLRRDGWWPDGYAACETQVP